MNEPDGTLQQHKWKVSYVAFSIQVSLKDIHQQEYSKDTLMIKYKLAQIISMTTNQDLKDNKAPTEKQMGMLYLQVLCLNMHRKFNHGLKQPLN